MKTSAGSSPRVRGTDIGSACQLGPRRFIPACAGNRTVQGAACHRFIPACASGADASDSGSSPRVRGTGRDQRLRCHRPGSSPRVRGTDCFALGVPALERFIPACAGNSIDFPLARVTAAVHPRVCGEQQAASEWAGPVRFIPACAGNSRQTAAWHRLTAVHPRVCGEQERCLQRPARQGGSSPRVRGTVSRVSPDVRGIRRNSLKASVTVHPRVCGEQTCDDSSCLASSGSSPRVRGTVQSQVGFCFLSRFIPACAGNRGSPTSRYFRAAVHPRVCGEQYDGGEIVIHAGGSSPRVRGTAPRRAGAQPASRFIPACAGNRMDACLRTFCLSVHPRVFNGRFIPACAGNSLDSMWLIINALRRAIISTGIPLMGYGNGILPITMLRFLAAYQN